MQVLMQGATDMGLWTQPAPNPVRYSLFPVCEALLMGRLFILPAALSVYCFLVLTPTTISWLPTEQSGIKYATG